jgi:hypothetical protein
MELFDVDVKENSMHSKFIPLRCRYNYYWFRWVTEKGRRSSGLGFGRRASTWNLKDMNISTTIHWIKFSVKSMKEYTLRQWSMWKACKKSLILQHKMPVRSPSAQADHRGDQPGGEAKSAPSSRDQSSRLRLHDRTLDLDEEVLLQILQYLDNGYKALSPTTWYLRPP